MVAYCMDFVLKLNSSCHGNKTELVNSVNAYTKSNTKIIKVKRNVTLVGL